MEQIYSFITWQSSLIGFYLVALRTVSMETVICRIFWFSKAAKFKSPTKIETLFIKIELSEVKEKLVKKLLKKESSNIKLSSNTKP